MPGAYVSKNNLKLCTTMGDRAVFSAYLGRSTQRLRQASIRKYTLSNLKGALAGNHDFVRRLAAVEIDQTDRGQITKCRTVVKVAAPKSAPLVTFAHWSNFRFLALTEARPNCLLSTRSRLSFASCIRCDLNRREDSDTPIVTAVLAKAIRTIWPTCSVKWRETLNVCVLAARNSSIATGGVSTTDNLRKRLACAAEH